MATKSSLQVKRLAGRIGAEIQGVQLSSKLDEGTIQQIKNALHEYKVIFFRGQHHFTDQEQEGFASFLGKPEAHPIIPAIEGTNYIYQVDTKVNGRTTNFWHADVTYAVDVPKYTILRGVKIPEFGGDTLFANTNTAFEDLPREFRELAEKLWAVHTTDYINIDPRANEATVAFANQFKELQEGNYYYTKHPVVHVHEVTGLKHLLLSSQSILQFLGYTKSETDRINSIFYDYITSPENTVRWHWEQGDVIIWDNLATQHYAANDLDVFNVERLVHRVTAGRHIPVSVDGVRSEKFEF